MDQPSSALIDLVQGAIDSAALEAAVADSSVGAICVFHGVTRNQHLGRAVTHLEYEAYPAMALPALRAIAAEIGEHWPGARVAMVHRLGRVLVGEASVVIAVSTPHRAEAFAACRHAIDSLKTQVPIWKKEFWADGSAWVEGTPLAGPPSAS